MNARLLALGAALLAVGCSGKLKKAEEPKQDPAYAFPHSMHTDLECTDCHGAIAKATKLQSNVRHVLITTEPGKDDTCSGCHDDSTAPATVKAPPARSAAFRFTFNHSAHVAQVKDCKTCHASQPEPGDAAAKVPSMATCTSCHNHQKDFAEARCSPCHTDLKGYVAVGAFNHQGDWLRIHGPLAKPSAESCAQCHDQTSCAECHAAQVTPARPAVIFPEQVQKPMIHRGDYVSRHVIDAQAKPASCRACHGSAFCESCHTQQGVTSLSINVRDPHPQGWGNDKSSGHFHGDAARRNITACAGCHDNGTSSVCVTCHQVGGIAGVNPHPRAFLNKNDAGDISKNAVCKACHH
ncbi:MAG: cytochrome c3 family protein [Anaeromyxobacter sp.]